MRAFLKFILGLFSKKQKHPYTKTTKVQIVDNDNEFMRMERIRRENQKAYIKFQNKYSGKKRYSKTGKI